MENRMTCDQARELDLIDYLYSLGLEPQKIKGTNFWYYSPFRIEKTPSFKVNRRINRWYDFGEGVGGNLIDFALRYQECTIAELLESLSKASSPVFKTRKIEKKVFSAQESRITIDRLYSIRSMALFRYLENRRIPIAIADQFCREVSFRLKNKNYYAIGFKNNSGGYELRNAYFKGGSRPKDYTLLQHKANVLIIFEGFFDFLSFQTILQQSGLSIHSDFLILNSLSLFEKTRPVLEEYHHVDLYLDNDDAGDRCTLYACSLGDHIHDNRQLYKNHKDLNDFLCHPGM